VVVLFTLMLSWLCITNVSRNVLHRLLAVMFSRFYIVYTRTILMIIFDVKLDLLVSNTLSHHHVKQRRLNAIYRARQK